MRKFAKVFQDVTDAPSVSVVLPVRDAWKHLSQAVASMRRKTLKDWELVVVDDGSVDGTGLWLQKLNQEMAQLRLVTTEPCGIAEALQTGCALARGRFIARMDADDVMAPERLERQAAFLESHPEVGLVSCRVAYGGQAAGYAAHVDWINGLLTAEAMTLRRFVEAPVAHPSVMFRRGLLEQSGGYKAGAYPEDYELWLRWLEAGVRFAKLPETLLTWNDPPDRLSRTDERYFVEAFFAMKSAYLANWLKREVPPERKLWLWGAGRITRQRFRVLADHGVTLAGFVDVNPAKTGQVLAGLPVRSHDDLPERESSFLLAGVGARGARQEIADYLTARGWLEGRDYLLVA